MVGKINFWIPTILYALLWLCIAFFTHLSLLYSHWKRTPTSHKWSRDLRSVKIQIRKIQIIALPNAGMKMQGDMCEVKDEKSQFLIQRKKFFSRNLENKIPVMITTDHFSVAHSVLLITGTPWFQSVQDAHFEYVWNIHPCSLVHVAEWCVRARTNDLIPVQAQLGASFW